QHVDQVPDRPFPVPEKIEDPPPVWLGEHLEHHRRHIRQYALAVICLSRHAQRKRRGGGGGGRRARAGGGGAGGGGGGARGGGGGGGGRGGGGRWAGAGRRGRGGGGCCEVAGPSTTLYGLADHQPAGLIMKASLFHDPGPKPTKYVVFGPGSWKPG